MLSRKLSKQFARTSRNVGQRDRDRPDRRLVRRESRQLQRRRPSAGPSTTAAPAVAKFGTLDSPCGKGTATGATDTGVTNTRSRSATATTPATRPRPGSTRRCRDAVKPMIEWCNDAGRHQRSQGRRQVLRRAGAAGHAGDDAGVQRQGVHARRVRASCSTRTRRRRASSASCRRSRASRSAPRSRAGPACNSRSRTRATRKHCRPRSRSRSCSPTQVKKAAFVFADFPATQETRDKAARGLPEGGLEVPQLRPALQHRR